MALWLTKMGFDVVLRAGNKSKTADASSLLSTMRESFTQITDAVLVMSFVSSLETHEKVYIKVNGVFDDYSGTGTSFISPGLFPVSSALTFDPVSQSHCSNCWNAWPCYLSDYHYVLDSPLLSVAQYRPCCLVPFVHTPFHSALPEPSGTPRRDHVLNHKRQNIVSRHDQRGLHKSHCWPQLQQKHYWAQGLTRAETVPC